MKKTKKHPFELEECDPLPHTVGEVYHMKAVKGSNSDPLTFTGVYCPELATLCCECCFGDGYFDNCPENDIECEACNGSGLWEDYKDSYVYQKMKIEGALIKRYRTIDKKTVKNFWIKENF